jgi:hypothetical protein
MATVGSILLIVVVLLAAVITKAWKSAKQQSAYTEQVENVFSGWNLPEIHSEILAAKTDTRQQDLETIGQVLKNVEESISSETQVLFGSGRDLLSNSSKPYDVFAEAAKAWIKASKEAGGSLGTKNLTSLQTALNAWQEAQAALASLNIFRASDKKFLLSASLSGTPAALYKAAVERLAAGVLSPADQTPDAWKTLIEELVRLGADRKDEAPWMREWFDSADQPEKLATLKMSSAAPQWLKDKVEAAKSQMAKAAATTPPKEAEKPPEGDNQTATLPLDPDAADAVHPISLVFVHKEPSADVCEVNEMINGTPSAAMKLFFWAGQAQTGLPQEWFYNKILSEAQDRFVFAKTAKSLDDTKAFIFSNERLTQIPLQLAAKGCRLIGFSEVKKDIVFDIRVINADQTRSVKPIFPETIEYVLEREDWMLPESPLDAAIQPKSYALMIKDPQQRRFAKRLDTVIEKCVLDLGESQMKWSNANLTIGQDIIKQIIVIQKRIMDHEELLQKMNRDLRDQAGSKYGSPGERERKLMVLKRKLDDVKSVSEKDIGELMVLRENLQALEPFIGSGNLVLKNTAVVRVKLTLVP